MTSPGWTEYCDRELYRDHLDAKDPKDSPFWDKPKELTEVKTRLAKEQVKKHWASVEDAEKPIEEWEVLIATDLRRIKLAKYRQGAFWLIDPVGKSYRISSVTHWRYPPLLPGDE